MRRKISGSGGARKHQTFKSVMIKIVLLKFLIAAAAGWVILDLL